MIISKIVDVVIRHKCDHIKKIGGRRYRSFVLDYGDIPVAHINEVTGKVEDVVNTRGRAYGARNRLQYRKKLK